MKCLILLYICDGMFIDYSLLEKQDIQACN